MYFSSKQLKISWPSVFLQLFFWAIKPWFLVKFSFRHFSPNCVGNQTSCVAMLNVSLYSACMWYYFSQYDTDKCSQWPAEDRNTTVQDGLHRSDPNLWRKFYRNHHSSIAWKNNFSIHCILLEKTFTKLYSWILYFTVSKIKWKAYSIQ